MWTVPSLICLYLILSVFSIFLVSHSENQLEYQESVVFQDVCNLEKYKGTKTCSKHEINVRKGSFLMSIEDMGKNGPEIYKSMLKPITDFASPLSWIIMIFSTVSLPTLYFCFPELITFFFWKTMKFQKNRPYGYIEG